MNKVTACLTDDNADHHNTDHSTDHSTDHNRDIDQRLGHNWQAWHQQLANSGERRLLLLAGEQAWAEHQALALGDPQGLWLGEAQGADHALPIKQFKTALGQEYPTVVFNAFSGLHPDALGAVAGTVQAGGLLILLCPPLKDWPAYPDPDLLRYVAVPEQARGLSSRFLSRFAGLLQTEDSVLYWPQGQDFPPLPVLVEQSPWQAKPDRRGCLNQQQRHALALLLCSARRRQPLILTADRGRGKSSLLGLAASRLLKAGLKVLVTAPSPQAIRQVLAHCDHPLVFMAPDALLVERPAIDILLIDEAAAIPAPLLLSLAQQYCCVFASTEHGYEGTGLGFQLKFQPQLLKLHPHSRKVHLDIPARWSKTDPLEPLVFRLLALNAQASYPLAKPDSSALTPSNPQPDSQPSSQCTRPDRPPITQSDSQLSIRWLSQDELLANETLLNQVFALLVLAHYQTSPSDLRQLLDGSELRLAVMFSHACSVAVPVAVALLIGEGQTEKHPLTPELSQAIWRGQRRPRGHLLPQSLAFHGGLSEACQFRYYRVMRIVVHPAAQQMGLGSQLLTWLQEASQQPTLECDFIGTSFGASPELLQFWRAKGFQPVRVGQSRDGVSGLQAVMLLWPSSMAAKQILPQWQAQFSINVAHYQQAPDISPEQVAFYQALNYQALTLPNASAQAHRDRHIAHDFAFYHRDLIADQPALTRFVASQPWPKSLTDAQQQLLTALLTPGAEPGKVAKLFADKSLVVKRLTGKPLADKHWQLTGHKAAIAQCRQILQAFFTVPCET